MNDMQKKLRKSILKLSHLCRDGNLQSAFSCVDMMWVLYDKVMNWSPEIATEDDRDIFIISKGQATLALHAIMIEKGMFSFDDMADIGAFNSRFCIQADRTKFPEGGIENSAGSLGHGLPFAAGVAHASKISKMPSKVFVLVGDGEFCEGTMWESCLFASTKVLDNLHIIIDDNDSVGAMIDMGNLKVKLEAFGFYVDEADGHDMDALENVLRKQSGMTGKPKALIAKTIRGFGSSTITENDIWFHKSPNDEEFDMIINEIDSFPG